MHAILASRRDLVLRLHKLRLSGDLAEDPGLRPAVHARRDARTAESVSDIELSDWRDIAKLHERTEGWAAGLRLAVFSLAYSDDPERFVAEFSGSSRTVAEYLLAEMLDSQPADVQLLLLRTSMVDRVNGELADLLMGLPRLGPDPARPRGSGRRLRRLPRRRLDSGSVTITCLPTCSGWSCATGCPRNCSGTAPAGRPLARGTR